MTNFTKKEKVQKTRSLREENFWVQESDPLNEKARPKYKCCEKRIL